MKKINSLKLVNLSKTELGKSQMNSIAGGAGCCVCGCQGPSSSFDNSAANATYGYQSPGGGGGDAK